MNKNNAYIECQYFASGLKSKFFGAEKRPDFLPRSDSVGLHNEVTLKKNDFVVELLRRYSDRQLTWIGVYVAADDADYGDRGNYCGVGAWFVDCTPVHISILIESLHKLCGILANAGINKQFEASANEFCEEYLGQYLVSNEWIPAQLVGIPFVKNGYDINKYLNITSDRSSAIVNLANSIHASLFARSQSEQNRYIYIVGSDSKITVNNYSVVETFNDLVKLEQSFAMLLSFNSKTAAEDNKAIQENVKFKSSIEEANNKISNLLLQMEESNKLISSLKIEKQSLTEKLKNIGIEKNINQHSKPFDNNLPNGGIDKVYESLRMQVERLERITIKLQGISSTPRQQEMPVYNDSDDDDSMIAKLINLKYSKKVILSCILLVILGLATALVYMYYNQQKPSQNKPISSPYSSHQDASQNKTSDNYTKQPQSTTNSQMSSKTLNDGYKDVPESDTYTGVDN